MEAERHQVAKTADAAAVPVGAAGLGRVLDHTQTVAVGDLVQAVAIDRQTGQIDRQQRAGARGDRRFQLVQVDIATCRIDVDEHRRRANSENHVGGRHPAQGRGDDFVPRPDAGDAQGDFQRGGGGTHHPNRTAADIVRQRGFEFARLRPGGEPARTQDFGHGGDGFLVQGGAGKRQKFHEGPEVQWLRATMTTPTMMMAMPSSRCGPTASPNSQYASAALTT